MNFFFHGASVTQQAGVSSYFEMLKERVNGAHDLSKKGYGGCHLDDAGFVNLHSDISSEIDVCILEWNTTGLERFDHEKLRYMVGFLMEKNIAPIFLILAKFDNITNPRPCDLQVLDFCSEYNILCLDYRGKIDPAIHLRDGVHTNEIGAKVYADSLYLDLFCKIDFFESYAPRAFDYKNFFIDSHRDLIIDAPEGARVVIEFDSVSENPQIILEVVVGPYSPLVDANSLQRICFWDRWCHYERPSFKAISLGVQVVNVVAKFNLNVLSDVIDYSDCAREFSFDGEKILKIRSVHGIGCSIRNISLN